MNFEEHAAKSLVLMPAGIPVPRGTLCISAAEAAMAAANIGPCVVKAQVPAGKRGKAGGIKLTAGPDKAKQAASQILGMRIGDYSVEEQAEIVREFYAAVLHDVAARKPLILFSTEGGMDIEEIAAAKPTAIRRLLVDIDGRPSAADIAVMLNGLHLGEAQEQIARTLDRMYAAFRARDFTAAIGAFEKVLEIRKDDAASSMMIERCRQQLENPAGEAWDGTTIARTK